MKTSEIIELTSQSLDKKILKVKTNKHSSWIHFSAQLVEDIFIEDHTRMLGKTIDFDSQLLVVVDDYFSLSGKIKITDGFSKKSFEAKKEKLNTDFNMKEIIEKIEIGADFFVEDVKKEEENNKDEIIQPISDHFNFDEIYSNSKINQKVEAEDISRNRKMQDLLNQTLDDNSRLLYYRSVTKGRTLNYSTISLFDNGITSNFLTGKTDTLVLKSPEQIKEKLSTKELEAKYSNFCTKKDLALYDEEKLSWDVLSNKIYKKLNAKYDNIRVIVEKTSELEKETGNWVFYAAWPFIEGNTNKVKVRTPLMFTPIEISYVENSYVFMRTTNPIKINSQLIQTLYSEKQKIPTNLNVYFSTIEEVFAEYAKHGILFNNQLDTLKELKTIRKEDFNANDSKPNSFVLNNIAIFENIIKSDDVYNDALKINQKFNEFSFPEANIDMFNRDAYDSTKFEILPFDIDKNKNQVVSAALNESLAIFGPPGTGKSEVITSILVKSIADGNNNLVVSEKDAALSVLMNRLRNKYNLDTFALKLNGNTMTNKSVFWGKIEHAIEELTARQSGLLAEKKIEDSFLRSIQKFNAFEEQLKNIGITDEEYIKNMKKIDYLFKFSKTEHTKISEHISKIQEAVKRFPSINEELAATKAIFGKVDLEFGEHESQLIRFEARLRTLISPPISYLGYSSINLNTLIEFGDEHKEMFKHLSNKHYSVFAFAKVFKENQMKIIEIQEIAKKYLDLKGSGLGKKLEQQYTDAEKKLSELEELKQNILEIMNGKDLKKVKNAFDISKEDIDILQKTQNISSEFYSSDFDDTHKLYEKYKKDLNEIFKNAKKSFRTSTISNIADKIHADKELIKKMAGLNRVVGYPDRSRPKPALVVRKYFDLISIMFPIIIATPNEVSRYLPNNPNIFKYGIFDEASQMFISRAFPSVHRCERVIIAGDEKQLTPSNWFKAASDTSVDENELDFDENGLAADSLLTWGKGRFKKRLLNVHYRSHSSKLIEYSNIAFYNGKLESIDTPYAKSNPIELITLDGVWADSVNEQEAFAVVKKIRESLEEYNSIGVVTINQTQQALIIKLIENDFELSSIFHSKDGKTIFVKNIENVQGDEADIIIFSIAYAPVDGIMKVGNLVGITSNRLNVAITRSKSKMVIFNSFKSNQLGIGTEGTGKNTLYKWVKWLEENTKSLDNSMAELIKNYQNNFKSKFEEEFFEMLQKHLPKNIISRTNFISNGYGIDIVLYDMKKEKFVGAIELDGDIPYLYTGEMRKDIQKACFLESLGWNIVRASSIGFWKNKNEAVKKVFARLKLDNN